MWIRIRIRIRNTAVSILYGPNPQDLDYLCPGGPVGGLHLCDEKVLQEGETQPPHLLHPRVCDSDTRHVRFRLWGSIVINARNFFCSMMFLGSLIGH